MPPNTRHKEKKNTTTKINNFNSFINFIKLMMEKKEKC